jgi:integrase
LAKQKLADLIGGEDPLAARKRDARAKTIGELCTLYLERHAPRKKSAVDDQRRIKNYILPNWKSHSIKAITRAEIADFHHELGLRAPYEANRVLALLRKMLNLARQWGLVEEGWPNPVSGIQHHPEKSRDRWLTKEELPRLAQAINEEPNVYARSALWLYLLTGMRKSEVLTSKWSDVDWDRREIRLGETKSGRVHYVPLSEPALAVLKSIPREEENPFIIPGRKAGSHLVNIGKPWRRVRTVAGVEDVRLHDLRRTVGSWLAQAGNDIHLIGKILNHSNLSTTAVYARLSQDVMHEALEEHGKRIMDAVGIK